MVDYVGWFNGYAVLLCEFSCSLVLIYGVFGWVSFGSDFVLFYRLWFWVCWVLLSFWLGVWGAFLIWCYLVCLCWVWVCLRASGLTGASSGVCGACLSYFTRGLVYVCCFRMVCVYLCLGLVYVFGVSITGLECFPVYFRFGLRWFGYVCAALG